MMPPPSPVSSTKSDALVRDPRTLLREEAASTAVETALVLPPFLLLLIGFFSFAIVLFGYGNATYAARAGVRYASVSSVSSLAPCTKASVKTLVNSYLYAAPADGVTIDTTWGATGNVIGGTVQVTVRIQYPVAVPYLNLTTVTIGSTAQRVIIR